MIIILLAGKAQPFRTSGGIAAYGKPQLEKLSRYLTPLPVLKSTTCSSDFTDASSISFFNAGKQAAPSGAQKIPSAAPISFVASINSSSETAIGAAEGIFCAPE